MSSENVQTLPELNEDEPLFRYVDLATLLWTLTERKLFFRDPSTADDPFEGQLCKIDVERMRAWNGEHAEHNRRFFAKISEFPVFISCWHNHPTESAIMWKAYGTSVSVAMRTTVARLRSSIPPSARIERIRYIDYDSDSFDVKNALNFYLHKRSAFSGELEVRALLTPPVPTIENFEMTECGPSGVAVSIDPQTLLEEIVLGPDLCPWFHAPLESILRGENFDIPVRQSQMKSDPYRIFKEVTARVLVPWDIADKVNVPRTIFAEPKPLDANDEEVAIEHNSQQRVRGCTNEDLQ